MELVNAAFWLKYSASRIETSVSTLNAAGEKLSNTISVFWGWYTLLFTAGVTFTPLEVSGLALGLLSIPIGVLVIAYCVAMWGQLPILDSKNTDPARPDEVRDLYSSTINKKIKRLRCAIILTFLSGLSIAVALSIAVTSSSKKEKSVEREPVEISRFATDSNQVYIISGAILPSSAMLIDIGVDTSGKGNYSHRIYGAKPNKNGHFTVSIPISLEYKNIKVECTWKDDAEPNELRSLTKKFEL